MWVLSTARAELHYFRDCAAIREGYAILSHTWTQDPAGERTFQDIQNIIKKCKIAEQNPRDHVEDKIRRCCEIAESDGYRWVWIDSCCIDKTSSTELSEAISSMFNWYALAEVCYVYLEDVKEGDDPVDEDSGFQHARWHSRGWTLQELLAPTFAIFFSDEWKKIGTKYDLRLPLSRCTGIEEEYLTRKEDFRVHASIARRMSWAAKRKTTRVEDEAYCLLGLFDVNMPTLYGEGRHAFQRLQAELAKNSTDATLFAWGDCYFSNDDNWEPASLSRNRRAHNPDVPDIFLFAPSPSAFKGWSETYFSPQTPSLANQQSSASPQWDNKHYDHKYSSLGKTRDEVPSFEVTSHGMKCRFPVADIDGVTIAVLPCQRSNERLGLLLHPVVSDDTQVPPRQVYYVTWAFRDRTKSKYDVLRLACLSGDVRSLRFCGKPVATRWHDIYIAAHPPTTGRRDGAHILQGFAPDVAPTSFRIPRSLIQTLGELEFFPVTGAISWDSASKDTMSIWYQSTALMESVRILLGTCINPSTGAHPHRWAWTGQHNRATWDQPWQQYLHDCSKDHIEDWPSYTREFGDSERTIRLVFAPCKHAPEQTLVLGLELVGSVYEKIQKNANISLLLPSCFSQRPVDAASQGNLALSGATLNCQTNFRPATIPPPPPSHQPIPALTPLAPSPKTSCLSTSHRLSKMSSAQTIAEDLHMSLGSRNPAGPGETHRPSTPDSVRGVNCLADIPSHHHAAMQEITREINATRDWDMHELRRVYDAQMRTLTRTIESQRDEVAQLKQLLNAQNILLSRILHNNGITPPAAQPPST